MNDLRKRGLRRGLIVSAVLIIGAALSTPLWLNPAPSAPSPTDPAASYASAIGGRFTLQDQTGRTVSNETLQGKPFAIFFGFTRCPDVCPTTLSRMAALRKKMGKDGDKFEIVFVSVDPEHDKPADIGQYLTLFETPILGLTGTADQLEVIRKAYHVYVKRVPLEGGDYTIDHTATIFLMARNGDFVTTIDAHEADKPSLEKLDRIIRS